MSAPRPDGTYTLQMTPYDQVQKRWPKVGKHIIASYTESCVLVYQAFNKNIAEYAVKHQKFTGCPNYNPTRMTWVKTNFLWMMYRCGFGQKDANQERVLGVWLKRSAFEDIISQATRDPSTSAIRIQWDPDYTPKLEKIPDRRAIQLGIKGRPSYANGEDIVRIEDVTDLAHRCHLTGEIPLESIYTPLNAETAAFIGITPLEEVKVEKENENEEEKEEEKESE